VEEVKLGIAKQQQQELMRVQDSVAVGVMLGPAAPAAAAYPTQDDGLSAIGDPQLSLAAAAAAPCLAGSSCHALRQLATAEQHDRNKNTGSSSHARTGIAAGTAVLLDCFLAHHTLAALGVQQHDTPSKQQREQQQLRPAVHGHELLLQATAPADVLLAQAGSCSGAAAGPQWFVDSQAAAAVVVPAHQATFTASPAQAGAGGAVHYWDVPAAAAAAAGSSDSGAAAAADVVIFLSGAKPCSGFRVWLQQQQHPGAEPSWVDVSAASSPLPVVHDVLVAEVREFR
jgi:hypothetical protein